MSQQANVKRWSVGGDGGYLHGPLLPEDFTDADLVYIDDYAKLLDRCEAAEKAKGLVKRLAIQLKTALTAGRGLGSVWQKETRTALAEYMALPDEKILACPSHFDEGSRKGVIGCEKCDAALERQRVLEGELAGYKQAAEFMAERQKNDNATLSAKVRALEEALGHYSARCQHSWLEDENGNNINGQGKTGKMVRCKELVTHVDEDGSVCEKHHKFERPIDPRYDDFYYANMALAHLDTLPPTTEEGK